MNYNLIICYIMGILELLFIPLIIPFIPCIFCYRYYKKKYNLKKSGYIVDPPFDYHINPHKYSVLQTHGILDVKIYTKYGRTYTIGEIVNGEIVNGEYKN